MSEKTIRRISIIGAGKVASSLGRAMYAGTIRIVQVCNRDPQKGRLLARSLKAGFASSPEGLDPDTDLVLVCVTDNAIGEVAGKIRIPVLVAHTSGSVDIDVLATASSRTGVLYPVQTFRSGRRLPATSVPFCIEASRKVDEIMLVELAQKISRRVTVMNSGQRRILHLAAVFASNFTNHLYSVARELTDESGIPGDLLIPLVKTTAGNMQSVRPALFQTGPAVRGDESVMRMHREMLQNHPDYRELYIKLSQSIIKQKREHAKL